MLCFFRLSLSTQLLYHILIRTDEGNFYQNSISSIQAVQWVLCRINAKRLPVIYHNPNGYTVRLLAYQWYRRFVIFK